MEIESASENEDTSCLISKRKRTLFPQHHGDDYESNSEEGNYNNNFFPVNCILPT